MTDTAKFDAEVDRLVTSSAAVTRRRQLHPEVVSLLRHRRDMTALRQVWLDTYWSEPPKTGHPRAVRSSQKKSPQGDLHPPSHTASWKVAAQKQLEQVTPDPTEQGPRDVRYDNFYPALARNPFLPKSQSSENFRFDALTRVRVPRPHWFDDRPPDDSYKSRKDINVWKNQVQKVVPPRPLYSMPADKHSQEAGRTAHNATPFAGKHVDNTTGQSVPCCTNKESSAKRETLHRRHRLSSAVAQSGRLRGCSAEKQPMVRPFVVTKNMWIGVNGQ